MKLIFLMLLVLCLCYIFINTVVYVLVATVVICEMVCWLIAIKTIVIYISQTDVHWVSTCQFCSNITVTVSIVNIYSSNAGMENNQNLFIRTSKVES